MKGTDPLIIAAVIILSIWQLFVKGVAIWKSAQQKQRNWFVVLFILVPLNDLGILEIIYLFRFSKRRLTIAEVKSWFVRG